MATERTYPALPCPDLDDSVAFSASLGFRATYRKLRMGVDRVHQELVVAHAIGALRRRKDYADLAGPPIVPASGARSRIPWTPSCRVAVLAPRVQ